MTTLLSPIPTPGMEQAFRCIDCSAVVMAEASACETVLLVIGGLALVVLACLVFARRE